MKIKPILTLGVILVTLGFSPGCSPRTDFDRCLATIVRPYGFSIVAWEARVIPRELKQLICGLGDRSQAEIQVVTSYFAAVKEIRTLKAQALNQGDPALLEAELHEFEEQKLAQEAAVERILERQIKTVLAEQDIFNPLDSYLRIKINFPPLNFKLEKPPHLLVISPRDRIESLREIILKPAISLEGIEAIEDRVDGLGVSSLVVELGGLGATYPSFVTDEASLRFTIDAASEEWLHQYLFFKPLGMLYALDLTGYSPNYEIATINETVASMVSKEIGDLVYQKYYSQYENAVQSDQERDSDFNQEMRDIRRRVDEYLARGEIEQAQEFMEEKRQDLAAKGYYLRKLNQAYFAFYGTYADSPTSISPIGAELKALREQSTSLKDFLNQASTITSRKDLQDRLE